MNGLKTGSLITFAACIGLFTYQWAGESETNNTPEDIVEVEGFNILPPVTTENLQVFLIEGEEGLGDKNYVPLSTAMEEELVVVQETGSVNQLSIDNNSDEYVFIHSGDIVKGGKQDRTVAYDVIIPPQTKNVSLQSFCVESGRWQARGNESVGNFHSNTKMLSSKDLKAAAKYDNDQSKVWANVAQEQQKLNHTVSQINGYTVNVTDGASATSLQLTLESEELEKAKNEMQGALENLLEKHPSAIGFAYAINGEVYGIDIYNNRALFEGVWEKISESIVIEAISNKSDTAFAFATVDSVSSFMNAVTETNENAQSKPINSATDLDIHENETGNVIFSTVDNEKTQWIHKNYMKIDPSDQIQQETQLNNGLNLDEIQEQR